MANGVIQLWKLYYKITCDPIEMNKILNQLF